MIRFTGIATPLTAPASHMAHVEITWTPAIPALTGQQVTVVMSPAQLPEPSGAIK